MLNVSPAGSEPAPGPGPAPAPAPAPAPTAVPQLGGRLRAERQRQGLSLRSLAAAVGVSASMISQIEHGKARPSVSTLYAITSRLGVMMEELFDGGASVAPVQDGSAQDGPVQDGPAQASAGRRRDVTGSDLARAAVVRPQERQRITMDTGVTWDRLGEIARHAVDFLLITYPPGATSSSNGGRMRHSGAEFGFVLSGELVLSLGFDEVHLRPGDAVSFPSTTPHGYRNDGQEPAVGVWFVIERDVVLGE
jgi:quercetin dioxygenase-like cupin family protein/DNA-binding XRE family transcriptional regulator